MRCIQIDASDWQTELDFYEALLEVLGAPDWHGRSINALIDSMIYGNINQVEPPYQILVQSLGNANSKARDSLREAFKCLAEERASFVEDHNTAMLTIERLR